VIGTQKTKQPITNELAATMAVNKNRATMARLKKLPQSARRYLDADLRGQARLRLLSARPVAK
jgi:hypothetical protein